MTSLRSPDVRFEPVQWDAAGSEATARRVRLLMLVTLPLAAWYFGWLLHPARAGYLFLYVLLVTCEVFNLTQAVGFWWTTSRGRRREHVPPSTDDLDVDVLIPTYGEPLQVVEPTVAAARALRGARVQVWLLDDGRRDEMRELADRLGVRYVRRPDNEGAKAGNLNNCLAMTSAPYVAVFDCDHVPRPEFLERTLGHMRDERMAFVQTPQYYANIGRGGVAAGAWGQQALFFGPIARGKDGLGATFCCGTNVVFRKEALVAAGGFPTDSLTEDFELSIRLHEQGWRSAYVPEVLACGLGPEDMSSYVSQQHRWARGCLGAAPRVISSRLPIRVKLQYLLSSMFFLTGWTFLVYMSLPVIRLLTGAQPVADASADQFLLHFLPYFAGAVGSVAVAGEGRYTFDAFTLMVANFWVHVHATLRAVLRRAGSFTVTPKEGSGRPQPAAVLPGLVVITLLVGTATFGLWSDQGAGTLNNVAFAMLHVAVLSAGVWPALTGLRPGGPQIEPEASREAPELLVRT
jgi:cellulose synthase (UDP-forming)